MPRNDDQEPRLSRAAILTSLNDLHATARSLLASHAVLACEVWTFDAAGIVSRSWHVPYRSVAVSNHSTDPVTVTSSPPESVAPTTGPSMGIVDGTSRAVINLAGRTLTLYGTAGDQVTVQTFQATQPPAWG